MNIDQNVAQEVMTDRSDGVSCIGYRECMFVYGGWSHTRLWALNLLKLVWSEFETFGDVPSPRLFHASEVSLNSLYLSGGEIMATHCYNQRASSSATMPLTTHYVASSSSSSPSSSGLSRVFVAEKLQVFELSLPLDFEDVPLVPQPADARTPTTASTTTTSSHQYDWTLLETFGDAPQNRSHHTMTAVRDQLIICGGRPLNTEGRADDMMTIGDLQSQVEPFHFYDVHILDLSSRTWRRLSLASDHMAPQLWGHTAAVYKASYVILYGGFDVSLAKEEVSRARPDDVAVATLNSTIYVFNADANKWGKVAPPAKASDDGPVHNRIAAMVASSGRPPQPTARALHRCHVFCDCLYIFGGVTWNPVTRSVQHANDFWAWDIEGGQWMELPFCLAKWPSKKLLSVVYGEQMLVANALGKAHVATMASNAAELLAAAPQLQQVDAPDGTSHRLFNWQCVSCCLSPTNWLRGSPVSDANSDLSKAIQASLPQSSQSFMLKQAQKIQTPHKYDTIDPLRAADAALRDTQILDATAITTTNNKATDDTNANAVEKAVPAQPSELDALRFEVQRLRNEIEQSKQQQQQQQHTPLTPPTAISPLDVSNPSASGGGGGIVQFTRISPPGTVQQQQQEQQQANNIHGGARGNDNTMTTRGRSASPSSHWAVTAHTHRSTLHADAKLHMNDPSSGYNRARKETAATAVPLKQNQRGADAPQGGVLRSALCDFSTTGQAVNHSTTTVSTTGQGPANSNVNPAISPRATRKGFGEDDGIIDYGRIYDSIAARVQTTTTTTTPQQERRNTPARAAATPATTRASPGAKKSMASSPVPHERASMIGNNNKDRKPPAAAAAGLFASPLPESEQQQQQQDGELSLTDPSLHSAEEFAKFRRRRLQLASRRKQRIMHLETQIAKAGGEHKALDTSLTSQYPAGWRFSGNNQAEEVGGGGDSFDPFAMLPSSRNSTNDAKYRTNN